MTPTDKQFQKAAAILEVTVHDLKKAFRERAQRAEGLRTVDQVMADMQPGLTDAVNGLPEIWRAGFRDRFELLLRIALERHGGPEGKT